MGPINSLFISAVLVLSFSTLQLQGGELSKEEQDYLTIASSHTEEVRDLGFGKMGNLDFVPQAYPDFIPSFQSAFQLTPWAEGPGTSGIGDIVNIGKLVWDIISSNRAVGNMETDMATALPKGALKWQNMVGWNTQTKTYNATYVNKMGSKVVDFTYRVLYTHGGQVIEDGKALPGQYLTGMTIIPTNLKVLWGFQLNAVATVPTATLLNVGTTEAPIASARMFLRYSAKSLLFHHEVTKTYTIQGNGSYKE